MLLGALGGCDSLTPSELPLPTLAELREAFGDEATGEGYVREGERTRRDDGFGTSAAYNVFSGEGGFSRLQVEMGLEPDEVGQLSIQVRRDSLDYLIPGTEVVAYFSYSPDRPNRSGGGNGSLWITEVDADRIAGVFAADVGVRGYSWADIPNFRRIQGGFNATRDSAGVE